MFLVEFPIALFGRRSEVQDEAFLAARNGTALTMTHLAVAAAREYRTLEKPLSGRELARGR